MIRRQSEPQVQAGQSGKLHDKVLSISENRGGIFEFIRNHSDRKIVYAKLRELTLLEINEYYLRERYRPIDILTAFLESLIKLDNNAIVACYLSDCWRMSMNLNMANSIPNDTVLFGLPVSFSDTIPIKNYDCSLGLIKGCMKPSQRDALIVEFIKLKGAIPFMKTTTSQGGLAFNCQNPIYGRQENEEHPNYICNSDGYVVSFRNSPFHVAIDVIGNVRMSAGMNRVCGMKPTAKRITVKGIKSFFTFIGTEITLGFMAKSAEDIVEFMRTIMVKELFALDRGLIPIPFNESLYENMLGGEKTLKIGYYTNLSATSGIQIVPSINRAVLRAVKTLKNEGFNVKEFKTDFMNKIIHLFVSLLLSDSGNSIQKLLKDEPLEVYNIDLNKLISMPKIMRKSMEWKNDKFGQFFWQHVDTKCLNDLLSDLTNFKETFEEEMNNFDLIICPVMPIPLIQKDFSTLDQILMSSYTIIYNLLDLPAGVVNFDSVTKNDIELSRQMAEEFCWRKDYLNEYLNRLQCVKNLPLPIQIIGHKYEDERVLSMMKFLEKFSIDEYKKSENKIID